MTIDEAIETLTNEHRRTWGDGFPKIRDAFKLGIEALKTIKSVRENNHYTPIQLMPERQRSDRPGGGRGRIGR